MKSKYLIGIVVLAFILRFFMLGQNPPSLNWDETSIGYNAYSILKTGKDEYGTSFPIEFRSFDDYKPPVYIYLDVLPVAIFGLTEFAVRFPSALFGFLSVIVMFYLVKKLFDKEDHKLGLIVALFSAFFLSISPWHLQFSRAAYEGNVGLFFLLLAFYLFIKGLESRWYLVLSSISFVICLYSYHSFRLVVPIFLLVLISLFIKKLLVYKKQLIISALIIFIFSLPIYIGFLNPEGSKARLSMVSIFGESEGLQNQLAQLQNDKSTGNVIGQVFHNRRFYYLYTAEKNYLTHFDFNYLFTIGAGSLHHHAKDMGMMYLFELPLLIWGLISVFKNPSKKIIAMLALLIIAPLPAAVTTGTPHGVRAIGMVPGLIFLVANGAASLYGIINKIKKANYRAIAISFGFLIFAINFTYYLNQYYSVTPREVGYFWQYGNKEVIIAAHGLEDNYDRVIMTYIYDQPYIYYLFYNKIDPSWYQKNWDTNGNGQVDRFSRKIGKYEFRNINFISDEKLPKTLLIGTEQEIPVAAPLREIRFPDGRIAYRIVGN